MCDDDDCFIGIADVFPVYLYGLMIAMKVNLTKQILFTLLAAVILVPGLKAANPNAPSDYTVTSGIVTGPVQRAGLNLMTPFVNNWTYDPGMEPVIVRIRGEVSAGGTTSVQCNGALDTSYHGNFTDGFFDGATIRFYRETPTEVQFVREDTILQYRASSQQGFGIDLVSDGAPLQAGDFYFIDTEFDDVPMQSVHPDMQTQVAMNGSWHTFGNVSAHHDRTSIPPVNGGETSLRLTVDSSEYVGLFQTRYGSPDDGHQALVPGRTYRVSLWMRQIGLPHEEVIMAFDEAYESIWQVFSGVTDEWRSYSFDFVAPALPEAGSFMASHSLIFQGPGQVWIDNFHIYDPDLPQFELEPQAMQAIQDFEPSVLRIWSGQTNEQLGTTLEDWTNHDSVERRLYNQGAHCPDQSYKLPLALSICEQVGAQPWLNIGPYMSESEWLGLMNYLAGSAGTEYADKRVSQGRVTPWLNAFDLIYFEIGNETWNPAFYDWEFTAERYGKLAEYFFQVVQSHPQFESVREKIRFVINGWMLNPGDTNFGVIAKQYCPSAHIVDISHYIGGWETGVDFGNGSVNDQGFQDYLFFSESRLHPLNVGHAQTRLEQELLGMPYEVASYEIGPGSGLPDGNTIFFPVLEAYSKSKAAGTATFDMFMDAIAHDIRPANFFQFNAGYNYASHTAFNRGFRPHPAWQALSLLNQELHGHMTRVIQNSAPTEGVPASDDTPAYDNAPLTGVYAVRDGNRYVVAVVNRRLNASESFTIRLPFNDALSVTRHFMVGDPRANNFSNLDVYLTAESLPMTGSVLTRTVDPGSFELLVFESVSHISNQSPVPVISQSGIQANPTLGPNGHFRVAFDQPVLALEAPDCEVQGLSSAYVDWIEEVSPWNGSVFHVHLAGLSEAGTVNLHIPAGVAVTTSGFSNMASIDLSGGLEILEPVLPTMTSPVPDTSLDGNTQLFTWSANGLPVEAWWFDVGTRHDWSDLFEGAYTGETTSALVSGLPCDGSTLHVRLWYQIDGWWSFRDFLYQACLQ